MYLCAGLAVLEGSLSSSFGGKWEKMTLHKEVGSVEMSEDIYVLASQLARATATFLFCENTFPRDTHKHTLTKVS